MAKQALFTRPFLGPLIRLLGAFPLQRDGMSKGTLEQAQRLLQDNKALLVFPEGTRSPNGELLPPKLGIGLMAKRVGVDIVPTLIMGTNYALPLRSRMIKLGYPLSVRFGERIRIRDFKELPQNKETYRVIVNRVMTKIRELKKQEEGK
jgi:1-acyl-sn-glycerol-3-phosphate acyltransferase